MDYQYVHANSGNTRLNCTRQQWLDAILATVNNPKPPEWWLDDQERSGRSRTTASIIWTRNYDWARKYVIWDQAPEDDFFYLGYRQL